jgi:4-amino-4-deoxy-L-arabinose transferase-like glycosyltransferase
MGRIDFQSHRRWFILILIAAAFIRLATLGAYPLTDNTEARYAEVAREMLASGEWITPQLHGEKYWSKPPLSIWLTAGSMALFGINEFAVRLAPFLLSLLVAWLTYSLAFTQRGPDYALASAAVLVSSVLFFISSGAVMTDSALLLGTTLSMAAFWMAVNGSGIRAQIWGYLFFLGLVIGLLAKGPVAVVLTFLPVGLWALWKNRWGVLWSRIPWISGLTLTAALTLPWYLAAEARTPGFLGYFIIGEHWKRFTQPGWTGDLYGSAHIQPRGMIWLFWLVAALPWSAILLGSWVRTCTGRHRLSLFFHNADDWTIYLLLWAVAPMLFFTLAGNILWTYVLPGLPALALLVAQGWFADVASPSAGKDSTNGRWPAAKLFAGLATPLVFGLMILVWSFIPVKGSQKYLLSRYLDLRPNAASKLVYLYDRPYSAEFYSSGNAIALTDLARIETFCNDESRDFFAVKPAHLPGLLKNIHTKLVRYGTYDDFILFGEPAKTVLSATASAFSHEQTAIVYNSNLIDPRQVKTKP